MTDTPKDRKELVGLLSTLPGFDKRFPGEAEEVLKLLKAVGLAVELVGLRDTVEEMASDLESFLDREYQYRNDYPHLMVKYKRYMDVVDKARAMLDTSSYRETEG